MLGGGEGEGKGEGWMYKNLMRWEGEGPFTTQCHSAWSHIHSCGRICVRIKAKGINKEVNCEEHLAAR